MLVVVDLMVVVVAGMAGNGGCGHGIVHSSYGRQWC